HRFRARRLGGDRRPGRGLKPAAPAGAVGPRCDARPLHDVRRIQPVSSVRAFARYAATAPLLYLRSRPDAELPVLSGLRAGAVRPGPGRDFSARALCHAVVALPFQHGAGLCLVRAFAWAFRAQYRFDLPVLPGRLSQMRPFLFIFRGNHLRLIAQGRLRATASAPRAVCGAGGMNITLNRLDPNLPDPVESRRRAAGRMVRIAYATVVFGVLGFFVVYFGAPLVFLSGPGTVTSPHYVIWLPFIVQVTQMRVAPGAAVKADEEIGQVRSPEQDNIVATYN